MAAVQRKQRRRRTAVQLEIINAIYMDINTMIWRHSKVIWKEHEEENEWGSYRSESAISQSVIR